MEKLSEATHTTVVGISDDDGDSNTSRSSGNGIDVKFLHDPEESGDIKGIEMKPLVKSKDEASSNENDQNGQGLPMVAPKQPNAHPPSGGGHGIEPGTATQTQCAVNIIISFVGAGLLGLPYAFSRSGWALGTICLAIISAANVYAMLLLIKCRKQLERQGHTDLHGYGDIGRVVAGKTGERFVNICLVISQVGFATAYIIFISANIYSIAKVNPAYVCFGCVPILALLVQAKEMKTLSPFSLIADCANVVGLGAVFFQDFEEYIYHHEEVKAFDFSNLLCVTAISVYSLEGVGLILPLESSCIDRKAFPSLLKKVIFGITSLMITFGCCGYIAFGSATEAPITLNLFGSWANFVKLALCLALYLTYPIMMFPVNEVIEDMFLQESSKPNRLFRFLVVLITALVAYAIPDFGKFLSLVGSSICTLLGFIIPCYFHLAVFERNELKIWEMTLDYILIIVGVLFGLIGTYDSFKNLFVEDIALDSTD